MGSSGEVVGVHLVDELPELLHYLFGHALAGCPGGLVEDTLLGEHGGAVAHRDGHGVGGAGRDRVHVAGQADDDLRSEEHTSELQSLMRISYAVICLKKTKRYTHTQTEI